MNKIRFSYCLWGMCLVWLMMGCTGNGTEMRQQLETLEQQNSSGDKILNDSLAESLVTYFDHHGDADEQMRESQAFRDFEKAINNEANHGKEGF